MTPAYRNQGDAVALDRPDDVALVDLGTGVAWRAAEFDAAADAAGRWCLDHGLTTGRRVGLLGLNGADWLVAFYGLQRAGAVPVPVSHKLPAEQVSYVLDDSGAVAALTDETTAPLVAGLDLPRYALADARADPAGFTSYRPDPDEPAMFLYTSGSTGRPKGVVLSQQSHLWVMRVRAEHPPAPGTRNLIAAPLYHMNALANVQAALATGAASVLAPAFEPRAYLRAITEHRVTRLTGVPPMMAMLMRETDLLETLDLSGVRQVMMGSAPASTRLFEQIRAVFPGAEVQYGYGTTESGPVAFAPHPAGLPTPDGSVGVADPHVELRLADGTATQGVLEIRCPALMTGYHNRPDVPDPVTADGYYHTRDIFRVDENGFYFFVGRSDDMFVSGGENIYPREVEQVVESHPDVLHAAVVPVPDEIKGTKPVAFVVARAGTDPTAEDIKRHVLAHAPAYQHPRRVWFVEALPLSSTNKIDRAALAARAGEYT